MECKLCDLDNVMCEMYENGDVPDASIVLEEEDFRIIADNVRIVMDDLKLEAREGCAEVLYDGEFMPDFSVTVLYEIGADAEDYLYWEQDGVEVTLHNFLTMKNSLPDNLSDITCKIEYEP